MSQLKTQLVSLHDENQLILQIVTQLNAVHPVVYYTTYNKIQCSEICL